MSAACTLIYKSNRLYIYIYICIYNRETDGRTGRKTNAQTICYYHTTSNKPFSLGVKGLKSLHKVGTTYGGKMSGLYLQFVLLLFGDFGEQFGFLSGQRIDQRITLRHQTSLKLHAALLKHVSTTTIIRTPQRKCISKHWQPDHC